MKTKRVTIKDIAELAGVSQTTAPPGAHGRGEKGGWTRWPAGIFRGTPPPWFKPASTLSVTA